MLSNVNTSLSRHTFSNVEYESPDKSTMENGGRLTVLLSELTKNRRLLAKQSEVLTTMLGPSSNSVVYEAGRGAAYTAHPMTSQLVSRTISGGYAALQREKIKYLEGHMGHMLTMRWEALIPVLMELAHLYSNLKQIAHLNQKEYWSRIKVQRASKRLLEACKKKIPDELDVLISSSVKSREAALFHFVQCIGGPNLRGVDKEGGLHILAFQAIKLNFPIVAMKIDSALSFYEVCSLASFAKHLDAYAKTPIKYHLPIADYLVHGIELFLKGTMTQQAFHQYIKSVLARGESLKSMLEQLANATDTHIVIESPFDTLFGKKGPDFTNTLTLTRKLKNSAGFKKEFQESNFTYHLLNNLGKNPFNKGHSKAWSTLIIALGKKPHLACNPGASLLSDDDFYFFIGCGALPTTKQLLLLGASAHIGMGTDKITNFNSIKDYSITVKLPPGENQIGETYLQSIFNNHIKVIIENYRFSVDCRHGGLGIEAKSDPRRNSTFIFEPEGYKKGEPEQRRITNSRILTEAGIKTSTVLYKKLMGMIDSFPVQFTITLKKIFHTAPEYRIERAEQAQSGLELLNIFYRPACFFQDESKHEDASFKATALFVAQADAKQEFKSVHPRAASGTNFSACVMQNAEQASSQLVFVASPPRPQAVAYTQSEGGLRYESQATEQLNSREGFFDVPPRPQVVAYTQSEGGPRYENQATGQLNSRGGFFDIPARPQAVACTQSEGGLRYESQATEQLKNRAGFFEPLQRSQLLEYTRSERGLNDNGHYRSPTTMFAA